MINFNYNHKIVKSLIKIERLKSNVQNKDFSYDVKIRIQKNSKVNDIFYLSSLIGYPIDLKMAEKIIVSGNVGEESKISKDVLYLLLNFKNCLDFNRSVGADDFKDFDINTLLHINKISTSSWRETWNPKYRDSLNVIKSRSLSNLDWFDLVKDVSDVQNTQQIYVRIVEILEWYKLENEMPDLVRLASLIYLLITLHPFEKNNVLTIAGFLDFLLIKYNFSYKIYLSVFRILYHNIENFRKAIYYCNNNYSIEEWLEVFFEALSKEIETLQTEVHTFVIEEEESKKKPFLDLNKRQIKILQYLQNVPYIKREDYCHLLSVSTMTAFRDLTDLVHKKLLKIEGTGRGTKYKLYSM